jgi:CheY-like chemotaxis protein
MLLREVAEGAGFSVLEAVDGASAMRVLETRVQLDLLITDVGLPGGLNGRQIADAARAGRPGLRVLLVTGYAESQVLEPGRLDPGMRVLTKPFSTAALEACILELAAQG